MKMSHPIVAGAAALALSTAFLSACSDFLEREPLDQLSEASFFKSESDLKSAIYAAYTPLQADWWLGQGWQLLEIPSDNTQPGGTDPGFTPIDNFNVTADNAAVAQVWANRYRAITLANIVIDRAPRAGLDEFTVKPYIAEAKFLRAIAYFDLVRLYGDVPLITTPPSFGDDLNVARSPVAAIYELIDADLVEAATVLPINYSGADVGRATKGAALAYRAKVQLTLKNFALARDLARQVVALNVYRLLPDFGDLWQLATSDNNAESVFQIQYSSCGPYGTGNQMQAFFAPYAEGITKGADGYGSQSPTSPVVNQPGTTIVDAFEDGDLRERHSLLLPGVTYPEINPEDGGYTYPVRGTGRAGFNIKKYVVGGGSNICFMSTPQNGNLIRYADVLLTIAEAAVGLEGGVSANPEAIAALNAVRQRAGLAPVTSLSREIVFKERRVEFAFESQRWFDMLRLPTEETLTILRLHGKVLEAEKLLFPIPSAERKINTNLTQNPGY